MDSKVPFFPFTCFLDSLFDIKVQVSVAELHKVFVATKAEAPRQRDEGGIISTVPIPTLGLQYEYKEQCNHHRLLYGTVRY